MNLYRNAKTLGNTKSFWKPRKMNLNCMSDNRLIYRVVKVNRSFRGHELGVRTTNLKVKEKF